MSRVALLGVHVLVALFDPDHGRDELANPAHGGGGSRASDQVARLRGFRGSGGHVFWPDSVLLGDPAVFDVPLLAGHRHRPDIYLLGLARPNGGCLATFERSIPVGALRGAGPRDPAVLAPGD